MITLQTKKITKKFNHVKVISKLSITIKKGQIVGIIGPNGSGKTTLLDILSGMIPFDEGSITFFGKTKTGFHLYKNTENDLSRTFQKVRIFEQMTVYENLLAVLTEKKALSSIFQKYSAKEISAINIALDDVGLLAKKNHMAGELSYGQKKLLEIARTLLMDTEIYLFDEPFAGLFPEMVRTVSGIFSQLKKKGKSVILVEHNMEIIRDLADYIYVMDKGKLLSRGKPKATLLLKKVIDTYLGN